MSLSDFDPAVARHVLLEISQEFLGASRAAAAVREQISDFLARHGTEHPPPILLRGEAGVGKSLLARLIHRAGPRPNGPFVAVDCTAPAEVFQSELFGYVKGAFSGALRGTPGAFQVANRGTLFLDHVDELAACNQPHLLVMLAMRSVRRIGSPRTEPADVWILTSAHGDLKDAIRQGRFREDLYRRLGELDLLIPPLRQRPDDILLLAEHFLARGCAEHHLPPKSFAPDTRKALLAYSWPGNVREVEHLIKRVASQFAENDIITPAMLALPNCK
jgi:DNA-binding NtrC family response regulator